MVGFSWSSVNYIMSKQLAKTLVCSFILASPPRKLLRFLEEAFHAHNFVAEGQFIAISTLLARGPRNVYLNLIASCRKRPNLLPFCFAKLCLLCMRFDSVVMVWGM